MANFTSLPRAFLYVVSQCIGSTVGGFLLRAALDVSAEGLAMYPGCYIDPAQVTPGSAFVMETKTSLFLLFLAFGLGLDPRNSGSFGAALGPFLIGASAATTLFAGGMARKGYLGSANNPARCLGLMTASNRFTYHYVHWAGDITAAMYVLHRTHLLRSSIQCPPPGRTLLNPGAKSTNFWQFKLEIARNSSISIRIKILRVQSVVEHLPMGRNPRYFRKDQ